MPVELVPFTGQMNLDDPDQVIPLAHHREARNVQFRGTQPNLRIENIHGTQEVVNPLLPPIGVNKTIGRFYDPVGKRIFYFNYNSADASGIYVYYTLLGTFDRLVQIGINNFLDPLGFTPEVISNIDIIYGDTTQGDILYWVDNLGRPSKINILRALNGEYGFVRKSFLDVCKEPSSIPPLVAYEDDFTITVNTLKKRLFKFKVRWVFDDQDKSVTSSQSEIPIPIAPFNPSIDSIPGRNARIAVVYQTGSSNVKKVEILAAVTTGSQFSDFFLVASLDKLEESISDNDVATYLFYNDKAYNYIDVPESIQLFDYVPQAAEAQVVLNGNVLSYGNITEGYPNLQRFTNQASQISNVGVSAAPYYYGQFYTVFSAFQQGDSVPSFGSIHIVIRGAVLSITTPYDTFYVYFTDGSDINYEVNPGDDPSDVIEGLRVDAIANGFNIVSVGTNDLVILKNNIQLSGHKLDSTFTSNAFAIGSWPVYDWWSSHGFGLVYFDEKGRTNGAVYTEGFSVDTIVYSESLSSIGDITKYTASIYHAPPSWAIYYQWVRTKDTAKSNFIQWISDRTFKDTSAGLGQIKYAYIGIESLNQFKIQNPTSPLSYSFKANDRIRFIKCYNDDGTTYQIYAQRDYEIISMEFNPTINGLAQIGQFIKIILPSTDGSFDFGTGFSNYFIELYTPAQSVANGLDVYYEFGERYGIINPGTLNVYHEGMLQNQSNNYNTPATFEWTKGDYWLRQRGIQTGNIYSFTIFEGGGDKDTFLIGMTFDGSTYNDTNIVAQSVPYQPLTGSFNPGSDTRRFIQSNANNTFRIEGTIVFSFLEDVAGDSWQLYLEDRFGNRTIVVPPFDAQRAGVYPFSFSTTITLNNNWLFLIGASAVSQQRKVTFLTSALKATVDRTIYQIIIDPNFSDYYDSVSNSNGRAFVFDPNANRVTFPTMYRWSLAYQEDTNINQTARFYPHNFDTVDRSWGAIKKMRAWDRILTFFQERKCGQTGIYVRFISDNAGTNQLITTDTIITQNNIQYYDGNFGCGNQPDSIVQSRYVYYFTDPILGKILRLSKDGITDLTELYKTQTWGGKTIPLYLKNYTYQFGGTARITGTFNVRTDNVGEYLLVAQRGTSGQVSIGGETLAFDEAKNAFTSFYDFAPESIVCAENVLYSWVRGRMYTHTNTINYTNFYGTQFEPSIIKVYNQNLLQKKTWISLNEVSNIIWDCPVIFTGLVSAASKNLNQQTNLITQDFEVLEGQYSASFLRDFNSLGGIANGDSLKSEYIVIKFRVQKMLSNSFVTLSLVSIKYIESNLNVIK